MHKTHTSNSSASLQKKKRFVRIVEAIVKDSRGKILLLKRSSNNSIYIGKWQLPGGKAEKGETAKRAIKREISEEVGCNCLSLKLLKRITFSELFKGRVSVVELNIFSCKLKGRIVLSEEHSGHKFVSSSKIEKRVLAPVSQKALFN